ncbi:MAG: metal-dependent transcriptional regulator [Sulfolobales archaeon]|nr:metal-dependent transcriptional regulator [Sulfolobales archaeon]
MSLRASATGFDDYITTIYRLLEVYGRAKTTLISKELGTKPATVSKILKYLENKGLVKRVKYRDISLTDRGLKVAKPIIRKHRIAEVFLNEFLGFDLYHSHLYAHKFEHLPDEVIERIYVKFGSPDVCPHGNSIKFLDYDYLKDGRRLSEVDEGSVAELVRIVGELSDVLKEISRLGLRIGSRVRIIKKDVSSIVIGVNDSIIYEISRDVADTMICRVV